MLERQDIDKAAANEDTCGQGYGARGELPDMSLKDYGKTSKPAPGNSHGDQAWERPVPAHGRSLYALHAGEKKVDRLPCHTREDNYLTAGGSPLISLLLNQDCRRADKSERERYRLDYKMSELVNGTGFPLQAPTLLQMSK